MLTRRDFLKKTGLGAAALILSSALPYRAEALDNGVLSVSWDAYPAESEPDWIAVIAQDTGNVGNYVYTFVPGDINHANVPSDQSFRYHIRAFAFKFEPTQIKVSGWSDEEPLADPNLKGNFTNQGASEDYVDANDYYAVRQIYGKFEGDPGFQWHMDINNNGMIDRVDLYAPRENRLQSQITPFIDNDNTDFRLLGDPQDLDSLQENYPNVYWEMQDLHADWRVQQGLDL